MVKLKEKDMLKLNLIIKLDLDQKHSVNMVTKLVLTGLVIMETLVSIGLNRIIGDINLFYVMIIISFYLTTI